MSKLEKLKEKARGLEAKDAKAAIAAWLDVIKEQESESEPNPDLSIFNRIGDLAVKVKDSAGAADWYDRAVDKYAELGFHNNAIAMCNKVLRNAPGRQTTYLKLAKLYAAKGFMAEAQQNFVTYAERMQKAGKLQQAFAALKEFTDISPESEHLRQLLEEHLRMYGEPRMSQWRASAPAPAKPGRPAEQDLSKSGKHKTTSLVFLDVDAPPASKTKPAAPGAPRRPTASPSPIPTPPKRPPSPEPEHLKLIEDVMPDPDLSLEIESTSLMQDAEAPSSPGMLEGLETTQSEYASLAEDGLSTPSLREELSADDVAPLQELEPTVPAEVEEPAPKPRVTMPKVPPRPAPKVTPVVPKRPPASPFKTAPVAPPPPRTAGPPPRLTVPKVTPPGPKIAPRVGPPPKPEAPKAKPVVPKRPPSPTAPPKAEPPKRKTVVEVPPLELEPDFDVAATDGSHDVDDEPLVDESLSAAGVIETEEDITSGFIDLGLDEAVGGAEESGSLVFADIEEAPAKPTIEELEGRVADDPDDPEAHQALGEALIEEGERERGIEELDHASAGYENRGNLEQAQGLVDEILKLDPNSVRHRQKLVEYAFKSGDKAKLIDAYLELADTLLRQDLPDKARAVYQRVAEHDPTNERAKGAIAMLAPVAPAPQAKPEKKVAAKDAKMKVRDETETAGDFVDLSAMVLDEEMPERDTRMKIADEEPTGDEERDFHDMLTRFRQGIEENIDEADFQSHYDLGIAFKEMGLLDEAIAELQKALRAPEGKLRVSEALGACFLEKGAYVVAESILRRALDLPSSGDQERLGILYWLARALEGQGKRVEARDLYGRVFAVDIRFMDVRERAKALAKAK